MTAQIQNSGLARITATLLTLPFWLGAGSGSAVAKGDNDLAAPAPEGRVAATNALWTTNVENDAISLSGTITALGARAITEIGAFDAVGTGSPPVGGQMDMHASFPTVNLNVGDSIEYTLRLTFA